MRQRNMRRGERCSREMQWKYHQIPQHVFSNCLVHMHCFTTLINRRLQSQSLSLTEELCIFSFFQMNQFMKTTETEEETYKVMQSQKISNRQNCEIFRNFRSSAMVPNTNTHSQINYQNRRARKKIILTWHCNAPLLWKQWN